MALSTLCASLTFLASVPIIAASPSPYGSTNATQEFDYIVIGSGPGGGSLAANLAISGQSVLLVEAGGDSSDDFLEKIPSLSARAAEDPPHSWAFFVEHYQNETQARRDPKYAYTMANGSYYVGLDPPADAEPAGMLYPRGATLGGSSQVNAMNFAWAPDNEWDYIANLTGDDPWNHKNMRRHLANLENCTYIPLGTDGHGFDGPLKSSWSDARSALLSPNSASYVAAMFQEVEGIDIDSTDLEGMIELMHRDFNRVDNARYQVPSIFAVPLAVDTTTGSRSSIAKHINSVIETGHPLTLSLHSLATKVLFEEDDDKPKAIGVEYMTGDALYSADQRYNGEHVPELKTARARKEVIVAGGTFNTPQILELSGIGPRKELENMDIPVLVDLPAVGSFMQDNYEARVHITADEPWTTYNPFANCTLTFTATDPCFNDWETSGSGPYAGAYGTLFMTQKSSVSWDQDADLFWLSVAGYGDSGFYPGFSITLRSEDPRQAPEIQFNYFAENRETDLRAIADGIDLALRVYNNTGIPWTQLSPDPAIDVEQAIMDEAFGHHATSTCRMGPAGDPNYCVDSKFRVNGVSGLRVVDASVLPRVPGAFPNGPTFAISRKAFEVILESE
ncbi:unnamed protein product [Zymoseptoria tritici ST99CH_1A5]|uniref:Glucose-methanol-choline oxidoreductase N-terminal domain-containing protein n=3 Tax=Zymoseptoria tritici TaxID=1047171 RepID=A0A1X7RDX2_ZYMT9|nr:unnamed protein product [Zymoseptoria tritici ST99CH_3D7]SMR41947.1 unnamed protein product [Zymoseptoria tritici ST99CH_1E4]SMR44136.1 unnamed protein product [Zymoseptoria tritici ST99CH_3D1]SMY19292.1 unnamed protein product [Zymoseptoria tritici ST99CH_1A5]